MDSVSESGQGEIPPLLLTGVWKAYPGVQAVQNVDFACMAPGEIHALVGENGAGKSTLMGIATGNVSRDRGDVTIAGSALPGSHPRHARRLGLAMAYQDDSLIPDLSVKDNLHLGVEGQGFRAPPDWMFSVEAELGRFGTAMQLESPVRELSVAQRALVEIVKATISRPSVLILDEPTAALTPDEAQRLHELLRRTSDQGVAVVYITHRLHEIFSLAHYVSVMRDGKIVGSRIPVGETSERELVTMMIGRSLDTVFPTSASKRMTSPEALLVASSLTGDGFFDVSIDIFPHQILGVAGVEGNGQREFIRALAGIGSRDGTLAIAGLPLNGGSVSEARQQGIVYISGDRRGEALFLPFDVRQNLSAGNLSGIQTNGLLSLGREREKALSIVDRLDIRVRDIDQSVVSLSGGNQQKVSLGRAVLAAPRAYLVEEPTQGVDAGARAEIYSILRSAADDGAAVVIQSSDAVELAGLCDRVVVFVRGRIAKELVGDELSEGSIVETAVTTRHNARDGDAFLRAPEAGRSERLARWMRLSDAAPIALLVLSMLLIGAIAASADPLFLTSENIGNLLFLAVPLGFAALAQALVMLLGAIDLSIGPLMALSTVAVAQIMTESGGFARDSVAVAAALGIGLSIGLLNAVLVLRFQIPPIVATLATYIFVQGVALLWLEIPGGYVSDSLLDSSTQRVFVFPWPFILLVGIAIGLEFAYRCTRLGRWFRAVGSRPPAARRLGAPSGWIYCGAYLSAGFMGALGGVFFAGTIGIGDPALGVTFTLASVSAVVIGGLSTWGGRGSILGPILGALLLTLIANASSFLNFPSHIQLFVQGGLMLLAIGLYSRIRATGASRDESVAQ